MEASTLQAPAVRARGGPSIAASLLRVRSDEQLVALFRAGNDDAFRTIHDRYRQRLFAYTRQMLPGRQDAEDALQDVFVRAYAGLRANDREVALRAWLYRVAHNRCVDELRRPLVSPSEVFDLISIPDQDPVAQADQRESLRRLITDIRRLPEQQRSALLMRELSGMSYAELAVALETTVPAVKSLLVRARMALALALEARETSCIDIREELVLAADRRVRPNAMARRHLRDCEGCRDFRRDLRGISRQLGALAPAVGPLGVVAKLVGFGFGGGASGGAAMSGGTAAAGGSAAGGVGIAGTGGVLVSAGALAGGAGHVATLLVATVVTAGGAVEIQHTIAPPPAHHQRPAHHASAAASAARVQTPAAVGPSPAIVVVPIAPAYVSAAVPAPPVFHPALTPPAAPVPAPAKASTTARSGKAAPAGKTTNQTGAPGTSTAGGSTTTSPTSPGAPVVGSTSVTGTEPAAAGPGSTSTSTSTGSTEPRRESGSGSSTTAPAQGTSGSSGSSSTSSGTGSSTGTAPSQSGSTPTGQ